MKKNLMFILIAISVFSVITDLHATPIRYEIGGQWVYDEQGGIYEPFYGEMYISDVGTVSHAGKIDFCMFDILSFNLYTTSCSFEGSNTNSFLEYVTFPKEDGSFPVYQVYWSLIGNGSWTSWYKDDQRGDAYPNNLLLPETLSIGFTGIGGVGGYAYLNLTKCEPVPEPATLLLFVFGLVGLFGFRKRIKG
jgi:hypothetical protein